MRSRQTLLGDPEDGEAIDLQTRSYNVLDESTASTANLTSRQTRMTRFNMTRRKGWTAGGALLLVTLSIVAIVEIVHATSHTSGSTTVNLNDRSSLALADVCTTAYAVANLPANPTGITIDATSVTANAFTNVTVTDQEFFPNATFDYCNVTFSYSHVGKDDAVLLTIWFPTPSAFKSRWLSTGGGGLAINSGANSVPSGIIAGAAAGLTDGGFGGFAKQFDAVNLYSAGNANWDAVNMFGYQAQHELAVIGQAYTRTFFAMTNSSRLYSYYQGCSEGGREGWSQVQKYGAQFDGAAIGAPAFRYSFQQVNHLFPNVVEQTLDYFPSPCEFAQIVNQTLVACDPLDGKTDGVIARSDLCKLNFDMSTIVGTPYNCAAVTASAG
ncbi:hypothetical protein HKX48_002669, partial [Thoreauomyces humboldtii]